MSVTPNRVFGVRAFARRLFLCATVGSFGIAAHVAAAQIDIAGPAGSVAFGESVTVLPNGNIVVTDPFASSGLGKVYLYGPNANLISTLSGSVGSDHIGSGGIVVVGAGHFVVISPYWSNGSSLNAGAVTWVNGSSGLNGPVTVGNSLVGSVQDDLVGSTGSMGAPGVFVLSNGNYVVASSNWNNGATTGVGAVTWASGNSGRSGPVTPVNSLIGSNFDDAVGYGGVTALSNGHYVVRSPLWMNTGTIGAGAATWGNGTVGISGAVSSANSLVGSSFNDHVGLDITALTNGHYVAVSSSWSEITIFDAGAVTWCDGTIGRVGPVSVANSLIGANESDRVGAPGVVALSNGNYVVRSEGWNSATANDVGAVTWGNGSSGRVGTVSSANSLVGSTNDDLIGDDVFVNNRSVPGVIALSNGHYVVSSYQWDDVGLVDVGAVSWGNGVSGLSGVVSAANSLVGATAGDTLGSGGVTALTNGHYVVASPVWSNGGTANIGAVTWINGSSGATGALQAANALTGTVANDRIGANGVSALANGNYVVLSPYWDNGLTADVGAVTWGNGASGLVGVVSPGNSLVGSSAYDNVGGGLVAVLANGHYVVPSPDWDSPAILNAGAATWASGDGATSAVVSAANSLIGSSDFDGVGNYNHARFGIVAFADSSYAVGSAFWNNAMISDAGAITHASGDGAVSATITAGNSVRGTAENGGQNMPFGYDVARAQLAVGRPASNIVSLFKLAIAPGALFSNGFE